MSSLENHHFAYTFPSISTDSKGQRTLAWEGGMQPFDAKLELDTNQSVHRMQYSVGGFTADECRRVIEIGDSRPKVGGGTEDHRESYRVSEIGWIDPQPDAHWLYHKIATLFIEVNAHYGFELLGLLDPLQYTVYGGGQHFDWHNDIGSGVACLRKLSMTVQLTDSSEYEGGQLEFLGDSESLQQRGIGTIVVFPSFLAHRVTQVTSGMRRSLVAWASGPSFR
jgi:PKHD-type hydroxylase